MEFLVPSPVLATLNCVKLKYLLADYMGLVKDGTKYGEVPESMQCYMEQFVYKKIHLNDLTKRIT